MPSMNDILDSQREQIERLTAQRDELLSVVKWMNDILDDQRNQIEQLTAKIETNQE